MKRLIFSISLLIAGLSLGAGNPLPATAPAMAVPRIEVFAFTALSQPGQEDWMGRGIQESLQSDVSRSGAQLLIPVHPPAPTDDAIATAKTNKADLAVIGTFQVVGDNVRVTGHLIDPATDATVGSFSATGPQKNLFEIEDSLGEQLRRLLPGSQQQIAAVVQPPATATPPVVVYQQSPVVSYPAPVVENYYDSAPVAPYYSPYNYYDGGLPFGFYGGIGIYPGYYGYGNRGYDHGGYGFRGVGSTFRGSGSIGRAAPSLGFGGAASGRGFSGRGGFGHAGGGGRR